MADGIALEGMRLCKGGVPAARGVRDGKDLEARAEMAAAAMMGAVAFQKGLGAIHALSHPIGALYDSHHGLTNGVFHALRAGLQRRPAIQDKMTAAARYLGLAKASVDGVIAWTLELREAIGIPHTLAGLEVGSDRFAELAKMALEDPTAAGNPVKLGLGELHTLYESALAGRV